MRPRLRQALAAARRRLAPPRSRREAWLQRWLIEPLRGIRRPAPRRRGRPADAALPRLLFVLQDAEGGVQETHRDLMAALHGNFACLVLSGSLHRLRLARYDGGGGELEILRTWWLRRSWSQRRFRHPEHREIYRRVLAEAAPDVVHVRHLLGHSLDLFDLCRERRLPLVLSVHDFYLACPSVHLLDGEGRYCGGRCTPSRGQCRLPIAWLDDLPVLKEGHLEAWRRAIAGVLSGVDGFVTTSEGARRLFCRIYPQVPPEAVQVIEHGRDFAPCPPVAVPPAAGGRVRLLAPGNLAYHKGSDVLRRLIELDRAAADRLELHVLGRAPAELAAVAVCHGPYKRDAFAERARAIAPSFAILVSLWPETYCHTLSEAWSVGLPALVSDLGALRERLLAHGGGWLLPAGDVEASYRRILEILDDGEAYRRQQALAHVRDLPSVAAMGRAYAAIYRRLLHRRGEAGPAAATGAPQPLAAADL
ncbi:MAG: glycosyltransferase [Acidobacteria bacterium]|nr:MAG: glycosyltransferase [Acidobacteriota bacterium]